MLNVILARTARIMLTLRRRSGGSGGGGGGGSRGYSEGSFGSWGDTYFCCVVVMVLLSVNKPIDLVI